MSAPWPMRRDAVLRGCGTCGAMFLPPIVDDRPSCPACQATGRDRQAETEAQVAALKAQVEQLRAAIEAGGGAAVKTYEDLLRRGHFQYASGRHGEWYVEKFRLLQNPGLTGAMCASIVGCFRAEADVVAGPLIGGALVAYQTALYMGARCAVAERTADGMGFRESMAPGPGDRVLVVDDVLTTGGSIRDTIDAVRRRGAGVIGAAVLFDRGLWRANLDMPLFAVERLSAPSYAAEDCPLCAERVPLDNPKGVR